VQRYFEALQIERAECYRIAERARSLGLDPSPRVEIPSAERLADRVEKLLNIEGIADIIDKHLSGSGREAAAISIAKDIVELHRSEPNVAVDNAIRVGLAVLTEGILVAPTGGIADIGVRSSAQGEYVSIKYAGPIRSAGGTAQAMSVLIGDVARRELGIERFRYTDQEIERFKEEIPLYKNLRNLQYIPSSKEIELILRRCPVCIDGEGTEEEEISGFRDLPRISTNRVRGGACLVIADGIAHKAAKLQAHVARLKLDGWEFLDDLMRMQREKRDERKEEDSKGEKYMQEMVVGRPVFSEPNRPGGFRLRYGRSRSGGIAALSVHPASMVLTEFMAVGTQLKIERPGKGTAITPCDSIDAPFVLLENGDLVQVASTEEATRLRPQVTMIVDLGDILIPYGEFVENNHPLLPGAYCEEWWRLECEEKGVDPAAVKDSRSAVEAAGKGVPLHPKYTYLWHDVTPERIVVLREFMIEHGVVKDGSLRLKKDDAVKGTLVDLCVPHRSRDSLEVDDPYALIASLGLRVSGEGTIEGSRPLPTERLDPMSLVNALAGFPIKPRAPTRIGARMGRPEKARERLLEKKKINVLFPMGFEARKLINILENGGKITTDVQLRRCVNCLKTGIDTVCRSCGGRCERGKGHKETTVDVRWIVESVKKRLGGEANRYIDDVMGVHGLISGAKVPELLEKGFLRAKHGVYIFKDGTSRIDMTDVPLTHFKPKEIGITVDMALRLGYGKDIRGEELASDEQIVELYPQDVIPSRPCLEYFVKVAKFIDDLLVKVYGLEPYYNAHGPEDLIGHLVVGLAPHTSCGVLSRVIGWTDSRVCYAHPYFHAAKRRNCDGDEDSLILLMDALLNFSRAYLPEGRGGMMDSPLVLATTIKPSEIDKEAQNMDIMPSYPLEFYRAAERCANPKTLSKCMSTVSVKVDRPDQYTGLMFTHDTTDLSDAPIEGAYSTHDSVESLLDAQIAITKKLRAVDENKVFAILVQHHFLRDMQGCLRKFHSQSFICSKCKRTTRRIPLSGKCPSCGGDLRLTITRNSVIKYLDDANRLRKEFSLSPYVTQRIGLMETFFETTFRDDVRKLDSY